MDFILKNLSAKRWIGVALIVLVGVIAYHNCLPNEMFWDDDDFINNNRYIRDFHDWPLWFSQNLVAGSYLVSNYWRPLLLVIFSIEWHLWHNWVYGWHAVSVGVHILAAIVLFFLIERLFAERLLALLTAVIFVVHPVHNEAVVYVNSQGDSQATFFVISSLLLYTRFRQSQQPAYASRAYWGSLLLFPLGILSKETGFVLVGLLPLMDFLLLTKANSFWGRVKQVAASIWSFIVTAVIYVALRATVLNFNNSFNFYKDNSNAFSTHISIRLLTFFKVMVQYVGFLFFPFDHRVERAFAYAQSPFEWDVIAGGLLVGFMLFCAFKYWREKPLVSFGIGWFFIALIPASNILVPINAIIYEHFLYMPMIGIVLVVVHLSLKQAQKRSLSTLLKIFAVIIIICWGVNIHRNLDWRTSIGFYEQLITYRPDDYRVINNLGMEYANKGIHDKALNMYLKAIALDPQNPVAYHNVAGTYRDTGHPQEALENFQKAVELNPNFIFSYRSLADLYWRMGDWEKCKENLLQILRMDPTDATARQVLQIVQSKLTP
jgi:tetratricopeptide (TPR) repeat protein